MIEGENQPSILLKGTGLIDCSLIYPKRRRDKWILLRKIRKSPFDAVFVSFINSNYEMAVFSYLTGIGFRVGYHSNRSNYGKGCGLLYSWKISLPDLAKDRDEIELHLSLLEPWDREVRKSITTPILEIPSSQKAWAREFLKIKGIKKNEFLIGFHPGAGKKMRFKCWPLDRFIELARLLVKRKRVRIIFFGGPEEKEWKNLLIESLPQRSLVVIGELSLSQTASLISCCSLFISNDSGLMNLAYAVGVPVAAIFGPTQVPIPPKKGLHVIRSNLSCIPCYRYSTVKCRHRKCLIEITPEKVLEFLDKRKLIPDSLQ
ncbi:glycosyltransferase family 9 protein [Candidatus Calescamantes bacterium]|nr:glycosyltransferase family 9 protein [Candidatus Calescamantes bacterium]